MRVIHPSPCHVPCGTRPPGYLANHGPMEGLRGPVTCPLRVLSRQVSSSGAPQADLPVSWQCTFGICALAVRWAILSVQAEDPEAWRSLEQAAAAMARGGDANASEVDIQPPATQFLLLLHAWKLDTLIRACQEERWGALFDRVPVRRHIRLHML